MAKLEIEMSCGFIAAPWLGLLGHLAALLQLLGVSEQAAIRTLLPLCGVVWTRVGNGRRHYSLITQCDDDDGDRDRRWIVR